MGIHYNIEKVSDADGVVELTLSFGVPAQNPLIVRDAVEVIRELNLKGGKLVKLFGPASIPVAIALGHEIAHLFGAVAFFDPKIASYVVCITHDPDYALGQQLP